MYLFTKKNIYPIYNGKYLYINDEKYEEKEVGKGSDVLAKKIGLVGTYEYMYIVYM